MGWVVLLATLSQLQAEITLARQSLLQAGASLNEEDNPIAEPPFIDPSTPFAPPDPATMVSTPLDGLKQHGLGVALIARIVFAHGGQIVIRSAPLQGFGIIMTWQLDATVAQ